MGTKREKLDKILIIRLSAIGDVLFGLPALEVLAKRFPGVSIHWLAEEKTRQIVNNHPLLDRVLLYPRKELSRSIRRPWLWPKALLIIFKYLKSLRLEKYDAVLDMQGNLKSAFQLFLTKSPRKIGFSSKGTKEGASLFLNEEIDPGPEGSHRILKDLRLLKAFGLEGSYCRPTLPCYKEARAEARDYWAQCPGHGPRIVVHPGSSAYNAYKRWPAERFAKIINTLRKARDAKVILLEGPGEEELISIIVNLVKGRIGLFPKEGDLIQMAAVIKETDLFLGCDSAPLHLAHLQEIPCVALFGPKDPGIYGPIYTKNRILRYPTPCHPCRLRTCPSPLCILGVDEQSVLKAMESLLEETQGRKKEDENAAS